MSLKFDDLSPAAESSPVSLQKLDRRKSQQFGCDLEVISVSLSYNGKERKEKEKRGHSAERRRKVDH